MTVDGLREECLGGVMTVTFDRPNARNALTLAMRRRLEELCATVDQDEGVQVVVITGTDPAFCAGADVKEIAALGASKPVIGAVNGPCITGGLEIALSCDFLIASDHARFADTHARLGVLPRWGMSALLPRAVGVRRAKELSATGVVIDAAEAHRIGLVNHVVPHDQLGQRLDELIQGVLQSKSDAVAATFGLYEEGQSLSQAEALKLEARRCSEWVVDLTDFGSGAQ
jgi:enoyl-CoA hydratase